MKFPYLFFSTFVGHFYLLDPDPDSEYGSANLPASFGFRMRRQTARTRVHVPDRRPLAPGWQIPRIRIRAIWLVEKISTETYRILVPMYRNHCSKLPTNLTFNLRYWLDLIGHNIKQTVHKIPISINPALKTSLLTYALTKHEFLLVTRSNHKIIWRFKFFITVS